MKSQNARRNIMIAAGLAVLLAVLVLVMTRCLPRPVTAPVQSDPTATAPVSTTTEPLEPPADQPAAALPDEALTPATLRAPARVAAGAAFEVAWTGPGNAGDFVAIVAPDSPGETVGNYRETADGATLELTAPIEPGPYEVRYVTGRSRTVLGRAEVEVEPVDAAVEAPPEVVIGSRFEVRWTGPGNHGDYITVVPRGAADAAFESYVETRHGSPVTLTAPVEPGEAEVRYVSGQGRVVLARRGVRVVEAEVSLTAPGEAVAGTTIAVVWTGPGNDGDYITVVPVGTPDGRYDNYSDADGGSPLDLLLPIMDGPAEIRYMTGQGHRVLARRGIRILAARITLSAPAECRVGASVAIEWSGPDNRGDYITIVPKAAPDGQYAAYTETRRGSPLTVAAPAEAGDAEIRYMTGQGNVVLARIPIRVVR